MSLWLLTVAMRPEAELLLPRLKPVADIGRRPAFQGVLAGRDILLVLTGMGQVNAASAATAALEARPEIEAVINLGCAGAYAASGLGMGQATLATEMVFADLGVALDGGLHDASLVGIPLEVAPGRGEVYNRLACDPALSGLIAAANPGLARGAFATVERISGDPAVAQAVSQRWGVILEEMEGAAVGLVALHYGRPFAALRGVSNLAGDRDLQVRVGAEAAQRAFLALEEAA